MLYFKKIFADVFDVINEALFYDSYEIIGGEKFPASSASAYHNDVMGGLYAELRIYLRK